MGSQDSITAFGAAMPLAVVVVVVAAVVVVVAVVVVAGAVVGPEVQDQPRLSAPQTCQYGDSICWSDPCQTIHQLQGGRRGGEEQ